MEATRVQSAEDLIRQAQLEKMASAPLGEEKAIDRYQVVNSCDGHTWRRKDKGNGKFGAWEDLGPTKR